MSLFSVLYFSFEDRLEAASGMLRRERQRGDGEMTLLAEMPLGD